MKLTDIFKALSWSATPNVFSSKNSWTMEELLLRIPGLGENIFSQLGNKSLADCKMVSKTWNNFISDQKFPSIRIIQKHVTNFDKSWRKSIKNTNTDMVKELATAVCLFVSRVSVLPLLPDETNPY